MPLTVPKWREHASLLLRLYIPGLLASPKATLIGGYHRLSSSNFGAIVIDQFGAGVGVMLGGFVGAFCGLCWWVPV